MKRRIIDYLPQTIEMTTYIDCEWNLGGKFGMGLIKTDPYSYVEYGAINFSYDDLTFTYFYTKNALMFANLLEAFTLDYFKANTIYEIVDYMTAELVDLDDAAAVLIHIEYTDDDPTNKEVYTKEVFLDKAIAHTISQNIKHVLNQGKSYVIQSY